MSGVNLVDDWADLWPPGEAAMNAALTTTHEAIVDPLFCHLYRNAAQTLPSNTVTRVQFNAVLEEPESPFNFFNAATPGQIVIPREGTYFLYAQVEMTNSTVGTRSLMLYVNDQLRGEWNTYSPGIGGGAQHVQLIDNSLPLFAGDVVEIRALQYVDGRDQNMQGGVSVFQTFITLRWIGN